jgi:hypothetical protein
VTRDWLGASGVVSFAKALSCGADWPSRWATMVTSSPRATVSVRVSTGLPFSTTSNA